MRQIIALNIVLATLLISPSLSAKDNAPATKPTEVTCDCDCKGTGSGNSGSGLIGGTRILKAPFGDPGSCGSLDDIGCGPKTAKGGTESDGKLENCSVSSIPKLT